MSSKENFPQNIVDVYKSQPRMALLMSDEGTRARAILEDAEVRERFDIRALVTDKESSPAEAFGREFGIEPIVRPVGKFGSPEERAMYFQDLDAELRGRNVDAAIYAGFLKVSTPDFCQAYPATSCHPADLSLRHDDGTPMYPGPESRVIAAMRADLGYIRSSIHAVEPQLDNGGVFTLTERVYPDPSLTGPEAFDLLKIQEAETYPQTLRLLGRGAIDLSMDLPLNPEQASWLLQDEYDYPQSA